MLFQSQQNKHKPGYVPNSSKIILINAIASLVLLLSLNVHWFSSICLFTLHFFKVASNIFHSCTITLIVLKSSKAIIILVLTKNLVAILRFA